jgi:hypothetical protein
MKAVITVMGMDAVNLGMASNRQPEVFSGTHWKAANSFPEAQRAIRDDPNSVRLTCSPRVLVEDIARKALLPDTNLDDVLPSMIADDVSYGQQQRDALEIIRKNLS